MTLPPDREPRWRQVVQAYAKMPVQPYALRARTARGPFVVSLRQLFALEDSCVARDSATNIPALDWLDIISRFWPHLVAGFTFLAALLASLHVLLHKRDSRAATLWLGTIWFLPLLGSILYLALGVNRIRRRAISLGVHTAVPRPIPEHLGGPQPSSMEHLEMLARVVGRVVKQPLTPGNRIQPLLNGDEAFPAMISAIESAKASVALTTYIFDNDPSGQRFVAALGRAVERGVAVRVLIDAAGTRYSWPPITRKLKQAQIPFGEFLPTSLLTPWRVATINLRNHR